MACHLLHASLQCLCCGPDITSMSESDWFNSLLLNEFSLIRWTALKWVMSVLHDHPSWLCCPDVLSPVGDPLTGRRMCFTESHLVMVIRTKLRVFETKVLRRIYGPTKEKDGTWQIKSNEELNRLTGNKNIINCIKTQRLAWFRNVHHMPGNSMVKKVYEWSPALTRSLGRPKK